MPSTRYPKIPPERAAALSLDLLTKRRSTVVDGKFLTADMVAESIGVTARTIYNLEHGQAMSVALGTMLAYCAAVGYPVATLADYCPQPESGEDKQPADDA